MVLLLSILIVAYATIIKKEGLWLQVFSLSLGGNALEGTLPNSWGNLRQVRMQCLTVHAIHAFGRCNGHAYPSSFCNSAFAMYESALHVLKTDSCSCS